VRQGDAFYARQNGGRKFRCIDCEVPDPLKSSAVGRLSGELERDDFSSNRHPALSFCLSMIFSEKPVPTFPDHALRQTD